MYSIVENNNFDSARHLVEPNQPLQHNGDRRGWSKEACRRQSIGKAGGAWSLSLSNRATLHLSPASFSLCDSQSV